MPPHRASSPQIASLFATLLVVGIFSAPLSGASHETATLPFSSDDGVVSEAIEAYRAALHDSGCEFHVADEDCSMNGAAWISQALGSVGVDPGQWPTPDHNVLDWMLAHPEEYDTSSGNRPMSYGLSISGLAAAGIDPYNVPLTDGGTRDLVAELLGEFNGAGFGIGNTNTWALFGLNAAGYEGSEADRTVLALEAQQNADGGFSWNGVPPSSSDMTAWAIDALVPHGRETSVQRAVDFLASAQVEAGPYRGCWPNQAGGEASAESTALVLGALGALRQDPVAWSVDDQSPIECLLKLRRADGSFATRPSLTHVTASIAQVVQGLAWVPYGTLTAPYGRTAETVVAGHQSHPTLTVADGFLRDGTTARMAWTVGAETRGNTTYHGAVWTPVPHAHDVILQVPLIPQAPGVVAPATIVHGEPFAIDVAPDDWWARTLVLDPPGAEELTVDIQHHEATTFVVTLDEPGDHAFPAVAKNAVGEAGPSTTVTVTATNDPPVLDPIPDQAVDENELLTFSVTVSDPEDDPVTITATGLPPGASVTGDGAFWWTPTYDQSGSYDVTFHAADPWDTTSRTATIVVAHVDRPPTLVLPEGQRVGEASELRFSVAASDPDGDATTVEALSLPAGAGFDAAAGAFAWTPTHDQSGFHEAVFRATANGQSSDGTVSITVGDANRPPVLDDTPDVDLVEGEPTDFFVTAADPDGDPVTFSITDKPAGAWFSASSGRFAWTPGYEQAGTYPVTFHAADDRDATDQTEVVLVVAQGNRAPRIDALRIAPDEPTVTTPLEAEIDVVDPDGDPVDITYVWQRNHEPVADLDASTVPTDHLVKGDEWRLTATASDGKAETDASTAVVIQNTPPAGDAAARPETPTAATGVSLVLTADDPDRDAVTWHVDWYRDDQLVRADAEPVLDASDLVRGDAWRAEATPHDGEAAGQPAVLAFTVGNAPPHIHGDRVHGPYTIGEEILLAANATDADGDGLDYSWVTPGGEIHHGATLGLTADWHGTTTAFLEVDDGHGGVAAAQQTLVVVEPHRKAAAAEDLNEGPEACVASVSGPPSSETGHANRPPELRIAAPTDGSDVYGFFQLRGLAVDPDGDPVTLQANAAGRVRAITDPTRAGAWCLPMHAAVLPDGPLTLNVEAVDAHGAASTTQVTVYVDGVRPAAAGSPQSAPVESPSVGLSVLAVVFLLAGRWVRHRGTSR